MIPKHYSLKAEHPQSYEIHDSRDGKTFHIAKHGLDLAMHGKLSKIQKFEEGGPVQGQTLGSRIGYPGSPKTPPKNYYEGGETRSGFDPMDLHGNPEATPENPLGTDVLPPPSASTPEQNPYSAPATSPGELPAATPGNPSMLSAELASAGPQAAPASPGAAPGAQATPFGAPISAIQDAENKIKAGADAEEHAKQLESKAWSDYSQSLSTRPSVQQLMAEKRAQNDKLGEEIMKGKIDPDRWWNDKGTGGKIAAGIGMILGGLGAGATGGPNMALETINKAIDRDIDAQKSDKSNKMSLWHMNRSAMQDDMNAELTTRNQMLTAVQAQIQKYATQAGGPQAQARVAPQILQLEQQKNMNSWMSSHLSGGTPGAEAAHVKELQVMQMVRPDLYKDMEAKYIPGVGVSRVPVTEKDRDALKTYDDLEKSVNEAIDFQKHEAGSLGTFPGSANNARAQSIKNSLVLNSNKLAGLNRLTEQELRLFQESAGDPGSFRTAASLAKFDQFKKEIQRKKQTEMMHLGVTPFQKAPTDRVALEWANANPNDPRAKQIKSRLGMH